MTQKNILISGGLGYVGGRLSKYFAESKKYKVYALSRNQKVKHEGIEVLSNDEVLKNDRLLNTKIDTFIHLAAANEIECSNNPIEANKVNINCTLQWLEWAKQNEVNQFIYFSTVHVYARPLIGSFSEESNCFPNHPYSITHKSAEDYALWYNSDFNLDVKIVRLSNSFGYPAFPTANRWTLFINDLCRQIAENKKIQIRSNVLQERDFISLSNVCKAVESLMNYQVPNSENRFFNLSKGESQTLWNMANQIKIIAERYLNEKVELIYDTQKNKKTPPLEISNQKIKNTGWQANENTFEEEIVKSIQFFQNNRTQ